VYVRGGAGVVSGICVAFALVAVIIIVMYLYFEFLNFFKFNFQLIKLLHPFEFP